MNILIVIYLGIWIWIILSIIRSSYRRRLDCEREEKKDSRELLMITDTDYFKVVEWVDEIGYNKFGMGVIKSSAKIGMSMEEFQRKLKEAE